ncbi:MAG: DAK2 domain-containing protein [Clostridia bacterium]|nr:DAK2 domain-containing protein [Clostridia bacterium]MBR5265708.1 DAK2 domain-containing protein [Clostridia bacterium]
MMTLAASAVEENKEQLNSLNVFPVPDGDTGTNMSLTLNAAARELAKYEEISLSKACEITSTSLLRGARGNSGVITSLLFRGLTKAMKEMETAGATDFANALAEGVKTAYKAVMKPAEGTILTVSRVSAEAAVKAAAEGKGLDEVIAIAIEAAKIELPNTMELNPVLKKAGVVDAGAYGYIVIMEGVQAAVTGKKPENTYKPEEKVKSAAETGVDYLVFDERDITFAYCTEFICERTDKEKSVPTFRSFLDSIGDSVVVVEDDEFIKVHVHTNNPDKALGEALKFGRLSRIKIENMREQFEELAREQGLRVVDAADLEKQEEAPAVKKAEIEKKYGFVSVAAGEGLESVFVDLGVDNMVQGGQTMNPSTEDILNSVDMTPAEIVFVLPNNKNIIMAAEQAALICEDKKIVVIPTRSVPQGISALLAFDPDMDTEENKENMTEAAKSVVTGQMTYAARDAEIDGNKITMGDFMALVNDKLLTTDADADVVIDKMAAHMCEGKDECFITIFYGEGADEDKANAVGEVFQKYAENGEINVIYGGQPVYSYIVSVE